MEEQVISPSELTVTFIHKPGNERKQKTWKWLDEKLKIVGQDNMPNEIPEIVAVRDSDTKKLFVYSGNIRTAHATQNNYNLRARIISNQKDLDYYLRDNEILWFEVKDFQELIELMRAYGGYPQEGKEMPLGLKRRVLGKVSERRKEAHDRWLNSQLKWATEFFDWHNND